jgi:hypothetical protein
MADDGYLQQALKRRRRHPLAEAARYALREL